MIFSKLEINGACPAGYISGVDKNGETAYSLSEFSGRYLVIIFYSGDWEDSSQQLVLAFSDLEERFSQAGAAVVACSTDSARGHNSWLRAPREDGGLGGCLNFPLWSDPSGQLASRFDLFEEEEGQCLQGVVILDSEGLVKHAMTTSMDYEETAENTLDLVKMLRAFVPASSGPTVKAPGRAETKEKDWDKSRDPGLAKAVQVAKRLGQPQPPQLIYRPKNPTFDLLPTRIRRLVNPRAPVEFCSATLYRNIAGFGSGQNASKSQRIQIENIMKKVLAANFMPEDLSGEYHSLENLSPAQVEKLFQREIFTLTGDREAGAGGSFEAGTGVYINNYDNFLLWVNKDDHLKLVSAARGQDIKYVLIRLHKVITKIEETLKSSQEKAFSVDPEGFLQQQREAGTDGTGLDVSFTLKLPSLTSRGRAEVNQTLREANMKLLGQDVSQALCSLSLMKAAEYDEYDIVTKTVEMVDKIWKKDQEL